MQDLLPALQDEERRLVEAASENFYSVARLTAQITILIFVLSAFTGVTVAYGVSRYLVRGLAQLKDEASAIGSGQFGQRIAIRSNDELDDLARAFNEMSDRLSSRSRGNHPRQPGARTAPRGAAIRRATRPKRPTGRRAGSSPT